MKDGVHGNLLIDRHEGVTTITLNDPATLNAITPEIGQALRAALAKAPGAEPRHRADRRRASVLLGGQPCRAIST